MGPYLSRIDSIKPAQEAFKAIEPNSKVITTSYLAPHLTQRQYIKFPRDDEEIESDLNFFNTILLNPLDPGWGSSKETQKKYIAKSKFNRWKCKAWENGQELCIKK